VTNLLSFVADRMPLNRFQHL